jgi:hypothetical protein
VNFHGPAKECSVSSPFWGYIPELMEVDSLAQAEKIKMLVEHFPLERASEAYRLLHHAKSRDARSLHPTTDHNPVGDGQYLLDSWTRSGTASARRPPMCDDLKGAV